MKSLDLEYLQWLQKHGKIYLTVFAVLTLLLCGVGFYWLQDRQQAPDNSQVMVTPLPDDKSAVQNAQNETDQKAISGSTPQPSMQTALPVDQNAKSAPEEDAEKQSEHGDVKEDDNNVEEQEIIDGQSEENKNAVPFLFTPDEEEKEMTVDPLLLPGYQSPCQGKIVGTFGMGYDLIYNDYRYHDRLTYQPSQQDILAVWDGMIADVIDEEGNGQVVLQNEQYLVTYQGLTTITAAAGDTVTKGQVLGTAKEQFTVKVVQR